MDPQRLRVIWRSRNLGVTRPERPVRQAREPVVGSAEQFHDHLPMAGG
jgi:hypothetical protein